MRKRTKFIYLISPNKINSNFYKDFKEVLKTNKVKYFQLRLKSISTDKIIKINESIINIIKYYSSNNIVDYNLIKKRMTQIKQSEKLIKTDYLKAMTDSERQIEKVIILTPQEEQIIPYVQAFMNFVGIDLISYFGKNTNKYIKEIYNIHKESLKRNPLTKKDGVYGNDKKIMLSILGFLLAYIQCNKIVIYDSFPGCIHSFDGFPLSVDEDEIQGITYFSCVLEKVSNKNTNPPYIAFKNMSDWR